VVALGEAAQPDDVAVVEAGQQLQLQVEERPSLSVAALVVAAAPDDGGDETTGEARPVRRAGAWSAGAALEHRGEAARGGLHLLGREPPEERHGTCVGWVPFSSGHG